VCSIYIYDIILSLFVLVNPCGWPLVQLVLTKVFSSLWLCYY